MTDDRETWYRVPRSAEECAVHLEAGGVVGYQKLDGGWRLPCLTSADWFRLNPDYETNNHRLVYSTPVGMSPVIGAPSHAYGLARQAPEGWTMHSVALSSWQPGGYHPEQLIEARPPAPEPLTEKVPLTKLRGRTLVGETEAVKGWSPANPPGTYIWWPSSGHNHIFPVDVDTGLVEVLAEEEA